MSKLPELWLRGPLPGLSPYLQPIAHALLQAREEVYELMKDFPESLLWERPSGVASAGFHLQHLSGVLDRLFSYARAENLTKEQLEFLQQEGKQDKNTSVNQLLLSFHEQVDKALTQLENT